MKNLEIKEILDANFKAVRAEMKADRDIFGLKLDEIICHQKATNGRVEMLEKQTWFFRMVHRNPKVTITVCIILFFGVVFLIDKDLLEILKFW